MASTNVTGHCPGPMKATSNGAFQNESPLDFALPLIILQIVLVVVFTRLLAYFLKPLKQPRVIAEIIVSFLQSLCIFLYLSDDNHIATETKMDASVGRDTAWTFCTGTKQGVS